MIRSGLRALLAVSLFVVPLFSGCTGERHVLLLVTIDGLPASAVSPDATPRLAEFLDGPGATEVHANSPETVPVLAAMMTGVAPDRLGLRFGDLARVPPETRTLAERLAERGYATAAFVGDSRVSERTGLARGFERYVVPAATGDQAITASERYRLQPFADAVLPAGALADAVGEHLRRSQLERRIFVWIHIADAALATRGDDLPAALAKHANDADTAVGYLADALQTFGLDTRADVVVAPAHGLALGDRGERFHGLTLAPSVVAVRAGHRGPGAWSVPGDHPVDSAGLGAAIAALAGLERAGPGVAEIGLFAWRPEREYGLRPRAAAGSAEGWLRFEPRPEWHAPSGESATERARWPERLVERLRAGGFDPDLPVEETADDLAARTRAIGRAIGRGAAGDEAGYAQALRALVEEAPAAFAPRLLLLRIERDADLAALKAMADGSAARLVDLARTLVDAGRRAEANDLLSDDVLADFSAGERLAAAAVLDAAGAPDRAFAAVSAVTEQESDCPELHEWLGDLALRTGNGFRARVAYETAVASPRRRTGNMLAKLGDAYATLGEDDKALERYAEAVALEPGYLYPHERAASVFLKRGENGAAAHALVQSVPETRNPAVAGLARAAKLESAGLLDEARAELEEILASRPGHPRAIVALAGVQSRAGRDAEALGLLEKSLDVRVTGPALLELARVHARAGRLEEALGALRRLEAVASPAVGRAAAEEPLFLAGGADSPLAAAARDVARSAAARSGPER